MNHPFPSARLTNTVRASFFAILALIATSTTAAQPTHTMKLASPYSYADTLTRLRTTLTARGMTIFATIDHQAGASAAGLAMQPATVVVFGNPKGGTPLMQAAPDFALELPLKVLVREDEAGKTWLVYEPVAHLEGRHGLPAGMTERLAPAEKLLESVVRPAAGDVAVTK
jgi:uncharacterized protein (DUF302 family)